MTEVLFAVLDNSEATITTVNEQYKTQQLLSIILIGIVGARYGQEIEPTKETNILIKGFTVENPEMIMKLSKRCKSLSNKLSIRFTSRWSFNQSAFAG